VINYITGLYAALSVSEKNVISERRGWLTPVYLTWAVDLLYHSLVVRCYGNCCCNSLFKRRSLKHPMNSDINILSYPAAPPIRDFYVLTLILSQKCYFVSQYVSFSVQSLVVCAFYSA